MKRRPPRSVPDSCVLRPCAAKTTMSTASSVRLIHIQREARVGACSIVRASAGGGVSEEAGIPSL
ncbi:hypothetical protein ACFFX0_04875 [Citricoccus parietis]|uniref:Uncharacterized protein n=1 Tax=Citricoccus parietis TaxID=592307 RepID=A0ABV5FV91_9MICC